MRPSLNIKERLGVAIAMSMGIVYEHPLLLPLSASCIADIYGVAVPALRRSSRWLCFPTSRVLQVRQHILPAEAPVLDSLL